MKSLFSLFFVAMVITAGCASTASNGNAPTPNPGALVSAAQAEDLTGYKIAPGDVLEISVFGEDTLNRPALVVKPDGKISFPLVGDVEAGGRTSAEVKDDLDQRLHEFIPTASTSVSVAQLGSLQYYIVGKVNKPGMYNVSKPLTVLQALALAGGMTPFAAEDKIIIMRSYGSNTSKLPFNYKKIKNGQNIEQNVLLQRGDVVVVP